MSLAGLLSDLAARLEPEAIFRAERDATRAEASVRAVREEDRDWDATVGDGIA